MMEGRHMADEEPEAIPVVVTLGDDDDTMGFFRRGEGDTAVRLVPVAALRDSFARTTAALREAFSGAAEHLGPLHLCEVQLGFEVSASGSVALVGSAQAKAAITVVFRAPGEDQRESREKDRE
jgi:hypothetical protein